MSNPTPVIPLEYAQPQNGRREIWVILLRWVLVLGWAACVVAWGLILVTAETVMATGPVIAILGSWALVQGLSRHKPLVAVIGAANIAICLLFLVLVNALHWSPREAQGPFLIMGFVYIAAISWPNYISVVGLNPGHLRFWPLPRLRESNFLADLSAELQPLLGFEMMYANAVVNVDWDRNGLRPLAIVFRDPLHLDEAAQALNIPATIARWEHTDAQHLPTAGWTCMRTGQKLSGPLGAMPVIDK